MFFWCFGRKVCGIPGSQPGIKPTPPALEGEVPTTGLPGKPPNIYYLVGPHQQRRILPRKSILKDY